MVSTAHDPVGTIEPAEPTSTIESAGPADDACVSPRRGRPRSAEVDAAVLEATRVLAGEVGITRLSVDEVAERAGVAKSTIYRRWPSKEQLVLDALRTAMDPLDAVDTGALRTDLDSYLGVLVERFRDGKLRDVLPHLIGVACNDPTIRESLDEYIRHRRQPLRSILQHAQDRGELAADADLEVLLDVILGALMYRRLLTNRPIDDDFVQRLLATVALPG